MKRSHLLIVVILLTQVRVFAQLGALAVNPTRLYFDDKITREEVDFVNLGEDTMTFTITFQHYRMVESGALKLLDKPDSTLLIADDYIRIFPRKVTLAPKEKQTLSVQYKKKTDMLSGEYRTHLTFSQFVDLDKIRARNLEKDSTKLTSTLIQTFKIAIPIIVRAGKTEGQSTISDIKIVQDDSVKTIEYAINRTGNNSLFGDIEVAFIPKNGKPQVIAQQNSIGVYPEIDKRFCKNRLSLKGNEQLKDGLLRVRFTNADKSITFCESAIEIR